MATRFPSLRIEGGFLDAELLDAISEGKTEVPGQSPRDFGCRDRSDLLDQISSAWSDARGYWQPFWKRVEKLQAGESGVTFTRNNWIVPFLGLLGYEPKLAEKTPEVDGLTFAISHYAGPGEVGVPVHVVGAAQSLDKKGESGRPRLAPHSLLQEYLNRTDDHL